MISVITGSGTSCGITARPPLRAIVSAILRPEIAVMFATTKGIVVPVLSCAFKSTSTLEVSSE